MTRRDHFYPLFATSLSLGVVAMLSIRSASGLLTSATARNSVKRVRGNSFRNHIVPSCALPRRHGRTYAAFSEGILSPIAAPDMQSEAKVNKKFNEMYEDMEPLYDISLSKDALDKSGNGLLLIEHLNLNVMDTPIADYFYDTILGCNRDPRRTPSKTPHHNCGAMTQFHTASPATESAIIDQGPQLWRGTITIGYTPQQFSELKLRVETTNESPGLLADSKFHVESISDEEIKLTCPWGNRFVLRVATTNEIRGLSGAYGRRPGSLASQPVGITELSVEVPIGTAEKIGEFYASTFGFKTDNTGTGEVTLYGGPQMSQKMKIVEVEIPPDSTGEHMAIYISNFEETFKSCMSEGVVWVNPRFARLDNTTDLESARHYKQFRIRHLVEISDEKRLRKVPQKLKPGEDIPEDKSIFVLEHEVRSIMHPSSPLKGQTNTKSFGPHPHIESTAYSLVDGISAIDHKIQVPLKWNDPTLAKTIDVYARELFLKRQAPNRENLPILLFLQGGPGYPSPRPMANSGWIQRALEDYRVVLLDQRGTGLSSPMTEKSLQRVSSDPEEQASYLENFRQDSIVKDCEAVRRALGAEKISTQFCMDLSYITWQIIFLSLGILGQSFGGFCALTYLSLFPESLDAALFTVGLAPVGIDIDDVYRATYKRIYERNRRYYERYPMDVKRVRDIVAYLEQNEVALPSGIRLTARRFLQQGLGLGRLTGFESLHYLVENAWDGNELSFDFLKQLESRQSFDTNPIYWILHEAIYMDGDGKASDWSASRMFGKTKKTMPYLHTDPLTSTDDVPVYFTGEMVYPWMAEEYPTLDALQEAGEILAKKTDWEPIYNIERLRDTKVPCAALISYEDVYVEKEFSERTASILGDNCKIWISNEFQHSALGDDGYGVLSKLLQMVRGEARIPS